MSWNTIVEEVKQNHQGEDFAKDWADNMVESGLNSPLSEIALVVDTDKDVYTKVLEAGETVLAGEEVEVARIPAFGNINRTGAQTLEKSPLGSYMEDKDWEEFVAEYAIGEKGLTATKGNPKVSKEEVAKLGLTWEDVKSWDRGVFKHTSDLFVDVYLGRVKEHIVGKINGFTSSND